MSIYNQTYVDIIILNNNVKKKCLLPQESESDLLLNTAKDRPVSKHTEAT